MHETKGIFLKKKKRFLNFFFSYFWVQWILNMFANFIESYLQILFNTTGKYVGND
jgi:hypothetical protein